MIKGLPAEDPEDTEVTQGVQMSSAHLRVPSRLKMSNLDCWGPGESIYTPILLGVVKKMMRDLRTPSVPSMSLGSQVSSKCQIVIAWIQGSLQMPILLGFVIKIQNFEFPAKRSLGALGTFGGWDPKTPYRALFSGSQGIRRHSKHGCKCTGRETAMYQVEINNIDKFFQTILLDCSAHTMCQLKYHPAD